MKFSYHLISWNLIRFPHPDSDQIFDRIKGAKFEGVEGVSVKNESELVNVSLCARGKGLAIVGISCPDIREGIEFSCVIGCGFYQIGGWYRHELLTGDIFGDLKLLTCEAEELGKYAESLGLKLAVHPHLNQICEKREEIDFLMENSSHVYLVIDTAHQMAAGVDPTRLFLDYKERVAHIHLKDWRKENGKDVFVALGQGNVNLDRFCETVVKEDYSGWVGIELDRDIGWCQEGRIAEVADKFLELNSNFLKQRGYLEPNI